MCPRDGATPCVGLAGSRDVTRWVWATQPRVVALFQQYDATVDANGNSNSPYSGFAADAFLSDFQPTFSFASTYQAGASASGWTASTDAGGLPIEGGASWQTNLVSFPGGFGTGPSANADSATQVRGAFLWCSAGLGGVVANDDAGSVVSPAGGIAVANVLANDWVDGARATLATATLSAAPAGDVSLNAATGQVVVAPGAALGVHTLTYQACAVAIPAACDSALVTATVLAYVIDARNDVGTASPISGGVVVANVLNNDVLGGARATLASGALSLVATDHAGVTLDLSDGSVDVAPGTALGDYSLVYGICELANPTNCDTALVDVTVALKPIYAGDDAARASSKVANTAIASVFVNATLGGVRASASTVRLSLVTAPPKYVVLDTTTGAVRVKRKTESGLYRFTYRICELADLTNCDDAVVTLDLSGSGN